MATLLNADREAVGSRPVRMTRNSIGFAPPNVFCKSASKAAVRSSALEPSQQNGAPLPPYGVSRSYVVPARPAPAVTTCEAEQG
jgi:hypothetical protein